MRNKDNREHSGADRLNLSRLVRERALSVRGESIKAGCIAPAGFNAGGTADHCKISVPEYSHVFRAFFVPFYMAVNSSQLGKGGQLWIILQA